MQCPNDIFVCLLMKRDAIIVCIMSPSNTLILCSIKFKSKIILCTALIDGGDTSISSILVLKILTLVHRIVQCCVQRPCTYDMVGFFYRIKVQVNDIFVPGDCYRLLLRRMTK